LLENEILDLWQQMSLYSKEGKKVVQA